MTTDSVKEKVEVVIATAIFNSFYGGSSGLDDHAEALARQFAKEALAALRSQGLVIVPREPTEKMLRAADEGDREYSRRNTGQDSFITQQGGYDHWAAMIAASEEDGDEEIH